MKDALLKSISMALLMAFCLIVGMNGKNSRTHKDLEWLGPPGRNTLLHYEMYYL
jgi:hypothetical protein